MVWLLFPLSVILGSVLGVGYKLGSQKINGANEIPVLVAIPSAILALSYCIIGCFTGFTIKATLILPALLAGVSSAICMYCLFRSMKDGNFAITIVLSNMSFCIPIILSYVFLKENVSLWQLGGILLMLAAIIVVNFIGKDKGETDEPKSKKWLIFAIGTCLFNGLINFACKIQQFYMPGQAQICFSFFDFLFCNVTACLMILIGSFKKNTRVIYGAKEVKGILLPCILIAVCLGVNTLIQLVLPSYVNASVQFTVCNGAALAFGVVWGTFYYKEKFTWKSAVTLLCCVVAIILQVI